MIDEIKDTRCTACEGKGWRYSIRIEGNTRVFPDEKVDCKFCEGTGSKRMQIFNWMKNPDGEKYIFNKKEKT